MPITGTHALFYSKEAEALRTVLRDVLGFDHVDDGGGWLIFRLPPAELGVHPTDGPASHELSFMCDDIEATVAELATQGIVFEGTPNDVGWGVVTTMVLPGDVKVLLYEPRHSTAV